MSIENQDLEKNIVEQDTNQKLPMNHIVGYGFGALGYMILFMTISTYLMYFLTDVAGVSASAAGTIFLIARLVDAVTDPLMGTIADKTKTRHGRYRPYILWGILPLVITGVFCFVAPDLSPAMLTFYSATTYILFNLAYTFGNIPYISIQASISYDPDERSKIISIKQVFAAIATLIASTFTLPIVNLFANEEQGFLYTMIIYGVVVAGLLFIAFKSTKNYKDREFGKGKVNQSGFTTKEQLIGISKNTPLLFVIAMFTIFSILQGLNIPIGTYYMTYNVERPDLIAVFMLISTGSSIVAMLFVPLLSKFLEKKTLLVVSLLIAAIGSVVLYFIPYSNIAMIFIFRFIIGAGQGLLAPLIFSMIADCIDFGEWKTKIRSQGLTYASATFFQKVGMGLGGWVLGITLAYIGYVPNQTQTPFAEEGILWLLTIIPAIFILLGLLAILPYKLDKKRIKVIQGELK